MPDQDHQWLQTCLRHAYQMRREAKSLNDTLGVAAWNTTIALMQASVPATRALTQEIR